MNLRVNGFDEKHSVRELAVECYFQIRYQGKSLDQQLKKLQKHDHQDTAFLGNLVYGAVRWSSLLEFWVDELLARPLPAREKKLRSLLCIALFELFYSRAPDYAVVNEAVKIAIKWRKNWARGLVNAVLRNARRKEKQLKEQVSSLPVRWSHPAWLMALIKKDWPKDWKYILEQNNLQAPMTLRVNLSKIDRKQYLDVLLLKDLSAEKGCVTDSSLVIDSPVAVDLIPRFSKGYVSVQDEAAQIAAGLINPHDEERILDACAAPGGKTGHLLEKAPLSVVWALEKNAQRAEKIRQNLGRLGLQAIVKVADAKVVADWWDGIPFDKILLDVPCSGTGVIRRHPDIKLLRRKEDFSSLHQEQIALLSAMWPLLKPGGRLVYSTCSIMRAENDLIIEELMAKYGHQMINRKIQADWGRPLKYGRQILPGESCMDGFYYAILEKIDET